MKHLKIIPAVLIVLIAMAMPSISAAQYYHEERLDHFIDSRPDLRDQLSRNPDLIYNKAWRERHPDLRIVHAANIPTSGERCPTAVDGAPMALITAGTSLTGGMITTPAGCTRTIPSGPRTHPDWRMTATSTSITNGMPEAGGTAITPIGSMRIIRDWYKHPYDIDRARKHASRGAQEHHHDHDHHY